MVHEYKYSKASDKMIEIDKRLRNRIESISPKVIKQVDIPKYSDSFTEYSAFSSFMQKNKILELMPKELGGYDDSGLVDDGEGIVECERPSLLEIASEEDTESSIVENEPAF